MSHDSHVTRTIEYLRDHHSMTSMDAIRVMGNTRISATIFTLRKRGFDIETKFETEPNRYGVPTRFGRYILRGEPKPVAKT